MAYNSTTGSQMSGDIRYENDPEDTQIDFENDSIKLKTGGSYRLVTSNSHVSASVNISGTALYAGGGILELHESDSNHAQIRTETAHLQFRNKANNKDIRFQLGDDAGATGVKVRNNSSTEVASIDSQGDATLRHLSASLGITGSAIHSSNNQLKLDVTDSGNPQIRATTNHLHIRNNANNKNIRIHLGDDAAATKLQIWNNSENMVASINSKGLITTDNHVSAAFGVTGSSFHGNTAGLLYPIKTVSTAYSATLLDYTILGNTASGNVTVTLPSASLGKRKIYNIKKVDSSNTLTITADSGSIDGVTNKNLTTLYESLSLHSNGSDWFII